VITARVTTAVLATAAPPKQKARDFRPGPSSMVPNLAASEAAILRKPASQEPENFRSRGQLRPRNTIAASRRSGGCGRLCFAAAEPGCRHDELFCIIWRSERTDQLSGMPVLECSPFDPFLLIEIGFTVAELQNVDSSFSVLAVELERASIFLPLYRGLTHSPPHIRCSPRTWQHAWKFLSKHEAALEPHHSALLS